MLQPSEIGRALVITAHPDDVDFGAAGTVATLTDAGVDVTYCLITDGDAGGFDLTIARPEMAAMRRLEQTRAAKEVGVTSLIFLGHGDGRVVADLALRRDLSRVIRQVRPSLAIIQSPERNLDRIYASHPDHLAAGEASIAAVYPDARNPFAHTELVDEGLDAWTVPEVWVMGGRNPNAHIDVTDQVERKLRALACHETQHLDPSGVAERVRAWLGTTATQFGLPEGRFAEAFQVVDTR
ncbi:MAG: PIG-L deacetylase family protein [Actinomycetota bacterium]|jgi:LmbE family N-acetylglucosaminyl deacetylase|nr:MAG: putative hydrolase [Acidimicrobiaceae bacterium]